MRRRNSPARHTNLFKLGGVNQVLEETGSQIHGSRVYRNTGVLIKQDPSNPSIREEIYRGEVICRSTWSMVP